MIEDRRDNMRGSVIQRMPLTLILFLIYATPVCYFADNKLHNVQEFLPASKSHHRRSPPSSF